MTAHLLKKIENNRKAVYVCLDCGTPNGLRVKTK